MFLVFMEFKRKLITYSADKLARSHCVKSGITHTRSYWPEAYRLTFVPYQLPYQAKLHFVEWEMY